MAWVCGVCGQQLNLGLYIQIQIGQGLSASPPRFLHKITLLVSHAPSTLPVAMDDNREIRAMILCSLPYPPLPVEARHFEDGNRLGETAVTTSHDILSHLLEVACVYKDAHADAERKSRQMEVFRCFLMDIVQNGMVDTEKLYSIYCKRTAEHIATYYPQGSAPQIRFMPFAYTCRGDSVHRRICDYMAGPSILLGHESGTTAASWECHDLSSLLNTARGHFVTEVIPPESDVTGSQVLEPSPISPPPVVSPSSPLSPPSP